ncbi:hypothetical protein D0817_02195 [Flavobacterium cupreum]|uniref:Uncharacterized protein n=1 Tax=Flavobacterium cupreum TaxID=2133766 RepID=A0A434ADH7_9FLAO|nr:hypothetical protein [Flavobacterium cupreum]RUT72438.1 hypothetical protein D0817_02195 [Flavobacterium cupreum]
MKNFYFLAVLLLSIFLMPDNTFACGSKSKIAHSATEMSSATGKKDCCAAAAGHKNKKHHCCHNNCKDAKCICVPSATVFLVCNATALKAGNYDFCNENQKSNHPENSVSSGFSSLFLKPKIG